MPELSTLAQPDPASDGLTPDAIDIAWQRQRPSLTPAARNYIAQRWAAHTADALARGKTLFDGPITCLIHATLEDQRLHLTLAPGDYKTFLVTTLRDRPWFETNAPNAIAAALGNSVLLTRKSTALVGLRSSRVAAYPGRAHLFGGALHLLPHAATGRSIADHLREELLEELGLSPDMLPAAGPWPRLLGLVRDEHLAQPELVWQWELEADLVALGKGIAGDEHTGTLILQRENLPPERWDQLTPVARFAWTAWRRPPGA